MPESPESARVVAAVLVEDATRLEAALAAVDRQSLAPALRVAVGGSGAGRKQAAALDVAWVATVDEIEIADDISHLWFVRDDVDARPDALVALVDGARAVEATVAGSKVLAADARERLVSIGGATDPLCVPVPLLEDDELDQGQYDVIRDVAYIPSQSVLIRRDAFRGLGGLDRLLAPDAAGIDFSQRTRVAGGRVVVVPSSEVFSSGEFAAGLPAWRERAGQLRALLKSYSWVSLIWVLPFWLLVAVATAVGEAILGRPAGLLDPPKVVAWNLKHLGSLVAARRRTRASRQVSDEELFRFQVGGSAALMEVGGGLVELLRRPMEQGQEVLARAERPGLAEGFFVTITGLFVWLFATRRFMGSTGVDGAWTGPIGDPALVLANYAGGWNPAGMGGDGPPHPAAALLALLASPFGADALGWVLAILLGLGIVGMVKATVTLGAGRWPGLLAGAITVLGTAGLAGGTDAGYPFLVGVAAVGWVIHYVAAPMPTRWRQRIGRLARVVLATGVLAMAVPAGIVIGPAVAVLVVLFHGRLWGLVPALVGVVGALPFLGPWLLWYDPTTLLGPAVTVWEPAVWLALAALVAWLPVLVAGGVWQVSATGGVLVAAGAALTRGLVPGREVQVLGFVLLAAGLGLVSGAALDRLVHPGGLRVLAVPAVAAALVLAIPVAVSVVTGVAGYEDEAGSGAIAEYLDARGHTTQERAIVVDVAHPGASTGDATRVDRVFIPAEWGFEHAWIGPTGAADRALGETVESLIDSPVARPGAALAAHGVRWVAAPAGSPLDTALSGRLDVTRLLIPAGVVFEAVDEAPIATNSSGRAWHLDSVRAAGPRGMTVSAAINPTARFEGTVTATGVRFPGSEGMVAVVPDPLLRTVAWVALGWMAVLAVVGVWGRRVTR